MFVRFRTRALVAALAKLNAMMKRP